MPMRRYPYSKTSSSLRRTLLPHRRRLWTRHPHTPLHSRARRHRPLTMTCSTARRHPAPICEWKPWARPTAVWRVWRRSRRRRAKWLRRRDSLLPSSDHSSNPLAAPTPHRMASLAPPPCHPPTHPHRQCAPALCEPQSPANRQLSALHPPVAAPSRGAEESRWFLKCVRASRRLNRRFIRAYHGYEWAATGLHRPETRL